MVKLISDLSELCIYIVESTTKVSFRFRDCKSKTHTGDVRLTMLIGLDK
jgi:hypothetical protein